jgi:hypothetical protein
MTLDHPSSAGLVIKTDYFLSVASAAAAIRFTEARPKSRHYPVNKRSELAGDKST